MNFLKALLIITISSVFIFSCKEKGVHVSRSEYQSKKAQGFWVIRNKKAITYNHDVAKPKRDKDMKKIDRQNKHRENYNYRIKKQLKNEAILHKAYGHN